MLRPKKNDETHAAYTIFTSDNFFGLQIYSNTIFNMRILRLDKYNNNVRKNYAKKKKRHYFKSG